jgi:hypothetical protein
MISPFFLGLRPSRLAQKLRQLGDIHGNPSRLISPTMMDEWRMGTIVILPAYIDDMVRS